MIERRSWFLIALLAACSGHARVTAEPPPPVETDPALEKRVDEIAVDTLGHGQVPGFSVVVMRKNKIVLAKGWGYADVEGKVRPDADTVYRIGSITKQFTAVAILKLAAQRKLSLDDDVTRYVDAPALAGKHITLRMLLTHTSGVHSYTALPQWESLQNRPMSRHELVELFTSVPLDFEPGSQWRYSNGGYYLLGMVVEKASGASYADFIRKQLTGPLGIDIRYSEETRPNPHRARGYTVKQEKIAPADPLDMAHPFSAGALYGSARELARWTRALVTHQVVTPAQWAEMTTPVKVTSGQEFPYGFGLAFGDLDGHRSVGHNGGINGFLSYQAYYPAEQVTVIVMMNSDHGGPDVVGARIARAALGLPEPVVKDEPMTEPQAAPFVGSYEFASMGMVLEIRWNRDHLEGGPKGAGQWLKLRWQGGQTFVMPELPATLEFHVEGNKATSVNSRQGAASITGRRIE